MFASQKQVIAFENLEARQLMAAHHPYHPSAHHTVAPINVPVKPVVPSNPVSVTVTGTVLNITGTTGNDQIAVSQNGNVFTITNGTWNTSVTGSFTQIVARSIGGNDSIVMNANVTVPCTFYAGTGMDTLVGGSGNDTFVTIGSAGDTITGGLGCDSFWMDNSKTEVVTDTTATEKSRGHVHLISSFLNGATKTLNGAAIADPTLTDKSMVYKNFSSDPLFAAGGPSENDINQGYLGDCYFLSALSATAKVSPDTIVQSIVSLGDGTFAVQMHQANGAVGFVRIDADLPTWGLNGPMAYDGLGAGNSLWGALLEKAFTYFRAGANPAAPSYATIDNGGWMSESFSALGLSNSDYDATTATQLGTTLKALLAAGDAVTIGIYNPGAGVPLIGDHAYTVDHVNLDSKGNVVSVTVRNPWGVDGAGNDGKNDGYVTVTIGQLFAASMGGTAAHA